MLRDRRLIVISVVALVALSVWAYALLPVGRTLELTVMDVGEGLCVVMRAPSGKVMVMDCGTGSWRRSESVGKSVVAPYLQRMGKGSIDVAVLSHPHADHVSGYAGLLKQIPAKLVLDTGARCRSPQYKRFLKAVKRCKASYRIAKRGQTIDMGGGTIVQVLSPTPGKRYCDLNNRSIVLRVVYKHAAIVLAADAGEEAENEILASHLPVRAQVLQVGHHGGHDSSSASWIAAVKPSAAIISCGWNNDYGHPSREVVNRLQSSGARVYRTDRDGAVSITTDGETVEVHSYGASH
ncbi:MAG: ComEC/Rec2 family competence protein [Armatimonadota bacterium]|nr:MBL fold metallo-hydrolase [bacterium]